MAYDEIEDLKKVNQQNVERLQTDWIVIAGESVTVEEIVGCYYGFGSELAVLRLFAKYNTNGRHWNKRALVGNSPSRGWYFLLERK